MRVLLTEGSGLTSRQVATRLGEMGHEVEVLSSSSLCLARFTRRVRRTHPVPAFGRDPLAWFEAARRVAAARCVDVLFPTQEQVTVLSALVQKLGVATIVPPFDALVQVQDKLAAFETLKRADVPQPEGMVVRTEDDLRRVDRFPVFVKRPIGTATAGVRRARTKAELQSTARSLGLEETALLVQAEVTGPLAMAQLVADHGRVVAFHACQRIREGLSGGAATKESLLAPELAAAAARLAGMLGWHGPLSLDAILGTGGPLVIDVNPRLVEPMNAWMSGVDLVGAALALARGTRADVQPTGRPGVRSHQLLLAVLHAASGPGGRLGVASELARVALRRGPYQSGEEELTPIARDPIAALPVAAAAIATLAWPSSWRWFERGAVGAYALTASGWREIVRAAGDERVAPESGA